MNKRSLVLGAVIMLALSVGAASLAQPSSKPAEPAWKPADERLTKEALAAYEKIKPAMLNLDYTALVKSLADNRRPVLPKAKQTDEAVKAIADKWKSKPDDFEKTKQVVVDVDAAKPKPGHATTTDTKVRDMDVTLVKISLPGTREVGEKHKMGSGESWTTDAQGNLAILMVKHDDQWYWNPFGW